jgi:DNA-directed RNA polymerase subunit E'/Rpb7
MKKYKMTIIEMTRDLKIHPSQIGNPYIKRYILGELQRIMKGECSANHGHIIKVIELKKLLDNKIENSSSDIVVTVKFVGEVFKPVVDDVHTATVIAKFTDGFLVNLYDIQKLLVMASTVDTDRDIKVGELAEVRITAVRYNDHAFSCIGVFI